MRALIVALVGLCWFTGLTAVAGGTGLMLSPEGSEWLPPLSLLEGTPFSSYFVPGLLLAGVVGLMNLAAGALVRRRHPLGELAALAAGVALTTWIVVQVLMLQAFHWLHALYLAVGLATIVVAAWLGARRRAARRQHEPAPKSGSSAGGSSAPPLTPVTR